MQSIFITEKQIAKYKNFSLINVGEKAYYLIHLKKLNIFKPFIPDFNLITSSLFLSILEEINKYVDNVENLHKAISQQQLTKIINHVFSKLEVKARINETLKDHYHNVSFAIRPSTTILNNKNANNQILSGLFPTYLNISNTAEILLTLKKIIKYILSPESFNYLRINNISIRNITIAFIIQRMIIPEVSGITYPYNPVTLNNNQIIIEAVFGLGNALTKGEVIPDTYIINKNNLQILEKKINPQSWMYIPKPIKHTLEQTQKVELSKMTRYIQKLDDNNIQNLAKLSKVINQHFHNFFLIEWGSIGNKLYILQLKNLTPPIQTESKKKKIVTNMKNIPIIQGIPIYKGGEKLGIIYKSNRKNLNFKKLPSREFILVINNLYKNELMQLTKHRNCIAIIFDLVPVNSDLAFLLQKLKIPSIGQTYNATKILKNNMVVKVDTSTGFIYKISTKLKSNKPKNKTQKSQEQQLITNLQVKEPGMITDKKNRIFLYFPQFLDIKKITNVIHNNPSANHILIYSNIPSKTLFKKYEQVIKMAPNNSKAYIIENFTEFNKIIGNLQNFNDDIYILINMQDLANSLKGNKQIWYKNTDFLQFIKPFMQILKNNQNIKTICIINKKNKTHKNSHNDLLIELGFIATISL